MWDIEPHISHLFPPTWFPTQKCLDCLIHEMFKPNLTLIHSHMMQKEEEEDMS